MVLLRDEQFSQAVGYRYGAFMGWRAFNAFIAERLPLRDPLDFAPFALWRSRAERARLWSKRATDTAAGGQPPLKDKFQATFQMTLLGNALLSRLWESSCCPSAKRGPKEERAGGQERFPARAGFRAARVTWRGPSPRGGISTWSAA